MLSAQLIAIVRLKLALARSILGRMSLVGILLVLVFVLFLSALSLVATIGLYYLGFYVGASGSHELLLLLLDGCACLYSFFFLWGGLMELQRGDGIDLGKMLHLPIRPIWIYLFNFSVSLLTPLLLLSIPPILALCAGLSARHGFEAIIYGVLFSVLFVLLMNSWAYYLWGLLALWMTNKRRRRLIYMLLPMGFVLLGQFPSMLMQILIHNKGDLAGGDSLGDFFPILLAANKLVPFLWPVYALWGSLTGDHLTVIGSFVIGAMAMVAAGVYLGYSSTLRHYASGGSESAAYFSSSKKSSMKSSRCGILFPKKLPFVNRDTSVLAAAFYRTYSRHPHMRMLLIMPACMGLFVLFMFRNGSSLGGWADEGIWITQAFLFWPFLNFSFFMLNVFGIEGTSYQALMLMPVPRYRYLVAKNLALAPVVLGLDMFLLVALNIVFPMSLPSLIMAILLSLHLYLLFSAVGNLCSVKYPHRINRDVMRAPVNKLQLLTHMAVVSAITGILVLPCSLCYLYSRGVLPTGGSVVDPVVRSLWFAVLLFAISVVLYWRTIYWAGDMLFDRERALYAIMARERE